MKIRQAELHEMDWINQEYGKVGFKPSNLKNELVLIAEIEGKRVGLGRLQALSDMTAELGGIYVNDAFRGRGIAQGIVRRLVEEAAGFDSIYCLPFAHLKDFYAQFDFKEIKDRSPIPEPLRQKHLWCNQTYEGDTLIMTLNKG